MKLFGVHVISSLLLALAINSRVEAFQFPNVTPDPDAPSYLFLEGEPITFLKRGQTTKGRYTLAETVIPPGGASPPHIHHEEDEWIYVLEGHLEILVGENAYPDINIIPGINAPKERLHVINATPGTLFYGEKYYIHGIRNIGTTPAKSLLIWTPSGLENLVKEVSPLVQDLSNPPIFNPEILSLFAVRGVDYGLISSSSFEQFGDIIVDNNFSYPDNHADKLLALLAENMKQVPEPYAVGGILIFGAYGAICIWKSKRKSLSKVA